MHYDDENELHSCDFGECWPNNFTAFIRSRLPIIWVKKDKQRSIKENMSSQLDNNELDRSNRIIPTDPEFQHGNTYEYNQHTRKEIVRRFSSFVVSTVVFLGILYNIWSSSLSSTIQVPPRNKERDASIWLSLLGLFGFMVFVCSVAVMILVGAPFNSVQKAMLIFWTILMHVQSANSIIEVSVTLVGGLFMVWYAFGKKQQSNEFL
ncbi:hypothetical protein P8452_60675 [Trifolium repens]|nr:hypothetical protein P8452_60675 [Trifolium repens]